VGGQWRRLVVAALLINTACYGCLFWGMRSVPTGLSAVLNLSLTPVGLFAIGLAAHEETVSARKLGGVVLGILGLVLLFLPRLAEHGGFPAAQRMTLAGMTAIVAGTLAFCWGAILSRPLLRRIDALSLSGLHHAIGGAGLLVLSLAFEPLDRTALTGLLEPRVLGSGLFLALGSSVAAFTIYLILLRDWGPSRSGLYAFVSPVVAMIVGVAILDETLGLFEAAGSLVLLAAAGLSLHDDGAQAPASRLSDVRPARSLVPSTTDDRRGVAS
jgi:drug/metabolite transporter (DMT)-like permease